MQVQTSRLFRLAGDDRNWVGYTIETGYMMFPAGKDGWDQRKPFRDIEISRLIEVPVHLAFNTGLPLPKSELAERDERHEQKARARVYAAAASR